MEESRDHMRHCANPHCSRFVKGKGIYCDEHKKRLQPSPRDPETEKFYRSERWQRLRTMKLNKDPLCEVCQLKHRVTPATMVHHLLPVRKDTEERLAMTYLVSLCHSCHQTVEAEMQTGGRSKVQDRPER
jgi:5-methylcytosine-specific restriction protein A